MTDNEDSDGSTPAAIVSLHILNALASASEGLGVTQLASVLGMPKARVHRHLGALRAHGYVMQEAPTSVYRVGWRLYLLGQACAAHFDVMTLAKPALERLRDRVAQTIVIATFDGDDVVVLDYMRGTAPVEITLQRGTRFPLHAVAQGKVVLAYGPAGLLDRIASAPLNALTPRTIVDPERLRSEVELVKRRGWADAPEELFLGVNALAAPIRQGDGVLFGTVALVGSVHYLPAAPDPAHVELLRETARAISESMGFRP